MASPSPNRATKRRPSRIDDAYSLIRRAELVLDKEIDDAEPAVSGQLRIALESLYAAEDAIGRAIRGATR